MPLYGGIDLHANNSVVVLLNDQDQVIYQKRLPLLGQWRMAVRPTPCPYPLHTPA